MKTLPEHMAFYGAYHRDPRNRLTHFVGVPMIVFAILIPMSLARLPTAWGTVTLGELFLAIMVIYYIKLDVALGLAVGFLSALLLWGADAVTRLDTGVALTIFAVAFIVGWILQLIGHRFEGNRPALLDNLFQILVSPIFLVAEAAFGLGLKQDLRTDVERRLRP
jgi:uncharacterized membrane protein YGL010W